MKNITLKITQNLNEFIKRNPWTLGFLILSIAIVIGIYRVEQLYRNYIEVQVIEIVENYMEAERELRSP